MSGAGGESRHLDAASWRALLSGAPAEPALVAHLEAGCEQCEQVLASQCDELDGAVDRALLAVGPAREAPLDELAWQRVKRRLAQGPTPAERTRRRAVGLLIAAGLALAAGASLLRPARNEPWDGLKRSGTLGPTLQVQAARRQSDQAFQRLDEGARLGAGAVLVLRTTSSVDGAARIFLQRGGEAPVEVGQAAVQAGTHELRADAGLLGVNLEGEQGEVKVWVVVGEGTFDTEAARAAISGRGGGDLAAASFGVRVE